MYSYIKNILDFISALLALLLLSPIFVLITIVLLFSNKGKPFFIQKRPGKNGKIFSIIKFKTMNNNKDSNGKLLPDYQRITSFGNFIREKSLDEIPQLLNVIKGDMSIVGPRPLLVSYLPLYSTEEAKRHLVKPGITGWAQVNGRNAISWKQKFEYDVWYVNHISFMTDLKILFKTIGKVFKSEGISASEEVTMELFTGTKD
ncbi:Sugar transferase involved in LPS biosynthesis (colanic, teichoic acid) [Maribacter sedimenticola]|uniref:Sugar transferase involved in LPS biosynthesis (Colanic, teichoic acid) n=1 Tax=Maribacter sedimenticola TaxID=228956 RepID=A0ABY1SJV2_9FLAO|nr:sugar transferase [Maribacter sedimenticola]SNR66873.1 Sugar transferase involved in LPS biosynthesis (colanic, teichoic acid) [Maribacter sedimenticola]